MTGRSEEVEYILARNPGILDSPDEQGYTPMRWAAIRNHGEIVQLLAEAGADPNSIGADGGTPLHGAAHHDDPRMMETLLAAGGDITRQNRWGRTPLHVAARRGCLEVARLLLDTGADPNIATHEGWTPLHVAYRGGHPALVEILLMHGANPDLADGEGLRPGAVSLSRREAIRLSRRILDEYVGHYDLGQDFGFEVWREGDRMRLMEFAPDEMVPIAPDTFQAVQEPWKVVFYRNQDGLVSDMDVEFLRRTVSARRLRNPSEGFSYVGTRACFGCHGLGPAGGPAGHWIASRHSRAVYTLTTDQARLLAANRTDYADITDPSQEQRCLMCHLTAAQDRLAVWPSGGPTVDEGVGCEACHGPGSDYADEEAMADRSSFLARGGKIPDELTCRQCHRDEAFVFLERLERIKHWR